MSSKSTNMRAILSVSNKSGLADFGRGLAALGVELVSTGGTATALQAAGLPVVGVSDITGFPEMMDGRVKTLHPNIHAGILARRSRADDLEAIARHGITPVDLVVVNLYPFAKAAQNLETPFDDLVEEIDIGGPSLVRAAAKNFRDVLVVVDPEDYPRVLEQLRRTGGPEPEFRFQLMQKAFEHTGMYDSMIAMTLKTVEYAGGAMTRRRCRRRIRRRRTCATARTRTRRHSGYRTSRRSCRRGRSIRARSCPTRTSSISTLQCGLRSSSPSRSASSSSTRTPAALRSGRRWPRRTCGRARPIRSRRSAASSGSIGRSTPRPRGR